MKYLMYGTQEFLVADAVANIVVDYAAALGQSGLADSVDVPAIDQYGCLSAVTLLIAPAFPLLARIAPDDELEPCPPVEAGIDMQRFLCDISWRTKAVRSNSANASC